MDSEKKQLKKVMQEKDKNQHIQVVVRARPMNAVEKQGGVNLLSVVHDRKEIIVKEKLNSTAPKTFTFDKVFGPNSKQIEIYQEVVVPILDEVLMGYNCTIFAYGQTGTGKTFTMEGERSTDQNFSWEDDPLCGIIPRTLSQLFDTLSSQQADFTVRVSFVELYNEELFDLLTGPEDNQRLRLYEDPVRKGSVVIHGVEEIIVRNKNEVYDIMERGASKRQTAATLLNAQSSRSHSVFSITVHIRETMVDGEELLKTGKLYLVDLAGSENIGRSGAVDKRAREAGNINQSLLTLGRVITSLVEHAPHIPYRESKLTRLLQDSLGGRTKTSIIATVSPSSLGIEETISTLDYAFRAKNITNRPEVNQKLTKKAVMKEYAEEIERLRRDLQAAREKNGIFIAEENYNAMQLRLAQQAENIADLEGKIACAQDEFEKLNELFTNTQKDLSLTKQHLSKTSAAYMKVKSNLNDTKRVLKSTSRERDENAYLVDVRSEKENILHSQAEQLLDVTLKTTKNLNTLHGKLDRKNNIEQKNLATLQSFQSVLESRLSFLKNDISQFVCQSKRSTDESRMYIDNQLKDTKNLSQTVNARFETFKAEVEKTLVVLEQQIITGQDENTRMAFSLEDNANKFSSSLRQQLNVFHSEVLAHCFDRIQSLTETANGHLTTIHTLRDTQHQQLLKQVEGFSSSHHALLESLISVLKEHSAVQDKKTSDILRLVAQAVNKQTSLSESIKSVQLNLDSVVQSQAELICNEFTEVTNLSNEIKKNEGCSLQESMRLQTNLSAVLNGFKTDVAVGMDDFSVRHSDEEKCFGDVTNNIAVGCCAMKSDSVKFVDEISHEMDAFGHTNRGLGKQFKASLNKSTVENTKIIKNLNETAIVSEKLFKANVSAFIDNLEKENKERNAEIKTWISQVDQWAETQTNVFTEIRTETSELLTEKIVKDNSSGETPVRQQFIYPSNLIRTSPHEQLLQRFREQNPLTDVSLYEDSLNASVLENYVENETDC